MKAAVSLGPRARAQWTQYGYILTSVGAAAWAPLIGFILLERKQRFSVSQWGPALMGFTDATRYLVLCAAFLALSLGMRPGAGDDRAVSARVYQARARRSPGGRAHHAWSRGNVTAHRRAGLCARNVQNHADPGDQAARLLTGRRGVRRAALAQQLAAVWPAECAAPLL
jgi:hypothetical protein